MRRLRTALMIALLAAGFGCAKQAEPPAPTPGPDAAVAPAATPDGAPDQRPRPNADGALAAASCSFSAPSCSTCKNPVTFAVTLAGVGAGAVASVRYRIDGFHEIGTGVDPTTGYALTYSFSQHGLRQISAHVIGAGGAELASCQRSVTAAAGYPDVPYFYQYNNTLSPSGSCQNTSVAMTLAHYGWKGKPDDITSTWGHNLAQSPAGLAQVFNAYAAQLGIPQRITPHTNGTVQGLRALLKKGAPVVVHGYFTSYGHVVVTLGFSGSHYVVNDPAGKWSETFKGGYGGASSPTAGRAVEYAAAAFEQAVATSDGSTYLPLWYHEIKP